MDDITPEQIVSRYEKLSPELQKAAASPDVHAVIQRIGRDKGLMLDQVGDLVDQVGLVILGFAKASSFVDDIAKRLSISNERAAELTKLINSEVLNEIRRDIEANAASIEESQEQTKAVQEKEDHISAIEKEGGFEIERPAEQPSNAVSGDISGAPANLPGAEAVEPKHEIMAGIENPEPVRMKQVNAFDAAPQPFRQPTPAQPAEQKREPLVEELLRNSTAIPEQKVVKQAPPSQPRQAGTDPYREAIE